LVLAGVLLATPASCAETVILVRHAEKAAAPADDPPLSAEGRQRAEALAAMLSASGASSIYVTEYLRRPGPWPAWEDSHQPELAIAPSPGSFRAWI